MRRASIRTSAWSSSRSESVPMYALPGGCFIFGENQHYISQGPAALASVITDPVKSLVNGPRFVRGRLRSEVMTVDVFEA